MKRVVLILALTVMVGLAGLTGCPKMNRTMHRAPLVNWHNQPVASYKSTQPTSSQVREVILKVCRDRDWQAREISSGLILATLEVRTHRAQVEIPFSGSSYSIIYKDSVGLGYDVSHQTIHRNYNNWVNNLREDIRVGLSNI
jgi:hypothetical protein